MLLSPSSTLQTTMFLNGHQRAFMENIFLTVILLWSTITADKHLFTSVFLYKQIKEKVKTGNVFSCTNNKHNHLLCCVFIG